MFEKKYKNKVVEWEGQVLRVDGNHHDFDEDPAMLIDSQRKHYRTHGSAEIMIRMDPPLNVGEFYMSDYDLLLLLDLDHFTKHQFVLDKLHVGTDIKFKGHLRNLGRADKNKEIDRNNSLSTKKS